jgi:heme exporter protein A
MMQLTAADLHLWRGDSHVLRGVSLSLQAGQCLQVSGANGAGKTSLLRALAGLLPLESGEVRWRNESTGADPLKFQREFAYLGHHAALKGDLTASENLHYAVGLRRQLTADAITTGLTRVGLPAVHHERLVRHMSAGQQRRVALARVLLLGAPLWLLDEPTSNLDADGFDTFCALLRAHLESGGVAVIATHQPLGLPAAQQHALVLQ